MHPRVANWSPSPSSRIASAPDADFRDKEPFVDISAGELPQQVEVFFSDGDHCPESQCRAITHGWPVLANDAVIVVDDTRHPGVLDATRQRLTEIGADIPHEWLLLARFNGDTQQRWNGLYVTVIHRPCSCE